jgi:hypothetical protein
MNFDKDNISDKTLKKISKYCDEADFVPEVIGRVSTAAKSLCMWVRAMESYGRIYRIVEPKRQKLNKAMAALKEKQDMLAEAQAKLAEVSISTQPLFSLSLSLHTTTLLTLSLFTHNHSSLSLSLHTTTLLTLSLYTQPLFSRSHYTQPLFSLSLSTQPLFSLFSLFLDS